MGGRHVFPLNAPGCYPPCRVRTQWSANNGTLSHRVGSAAASSLSSLCLCLRWNHGRGRSCCGQRGEPFPCRTCSRRTGAVRRLFKPLCLITGGNSRPLRRRSCVQECFLSVRQIKIGGGPTNPSLKDWFELGVDTAECWRRWITGIEVQCYDQLLCSLAVMWREVLQSCSMCSRPGGSGVLPLCPQRAGSDLRAWT